jgi:hypothetical protein
MTLRPRRLGVRGVLAALVLGAPAAACVRIDGGAVEVSWVVRSADGQAITDCSCADPPIAQVKLDLVGVGPTIGGTRPCDNRAQCVFACQLQTGSTPFDIPETPGGEMYEISVTAVGTDGAEIPGDQVMSPAPILRSVSRGQPTEVEAFLLVARCGCGSSGGGMNTSGVCTRQ